MNPLLDFNKQEIQRGPYIDSTTGEPVRVYHLEDDKLYLASPYDTFNEDQRPPVLTPEDASRLIRINSPDGLRKLLDVTQYVGDPRSPKIDCLPRSDIPFRGHFGTFLKSK